MRRFDDYPSHIREVRRAAMCEGKEKLTRGNATLLVRKTLKVKLEAYKCPFCESWHVGRKK